MKKITGIGEIILRLSTIGHTKLEDADRFNAFYGGSEANVLTAMALMGHKSQLLSAVPDSPIGNSAIARLVSKGLDTRFIFRQGERMPLYYLEPGVSVRNGLIIYDRKNASFNTLKQDQIDWSEFFDGADIFHWSGITPGLSKQAGLLCRTAVMEASRRGIMVSCDLHFRKNLWDYGIAPENYIPELLEVTDILSGDPLTICRMTGIAPGKEDKLTHEEIHESFLEVKNHFPGIRYVCMLSRDVRSNSDHSLTGLLLGTEFSRSLTIQVSPIIDRIGGGDAFMAGILNGILSDESEQKIIDYATKIAAYKHTIHGDSLSGNLPNLNGNMEIDR